MQSGILRTRRARRLRTPHPRQTGASEALPDCTLLGSGQLHCPSTARRRGRVRREHRLFAHFHLRPLLDPPRRRPASPAQPKSPTRTESREGPALRTSGNAIGRKASRVPPRAGRGGLPRLAAPAPPPPHPWPRPLPAPAPVGFPGSGCARGYPLQEREQKIRLASCSPC